MTRPMPHFTAADKARFFSKILRIDTGCLEWQGPRKTSGHGQFGHGGHNQRKLAAARVAYFLATGVDPGELCVLHRCDNPPCCEPAHLFLGTQQDNMLDMTLKGRRVAGVTHGRVKLTLEQVMLIRASADSQTALARRFGVAQPAISRIISGKRWAHV